jgi:hypothetical protein
LQHEDWIHFPSDFRKEVDVPGLIVHSDQGLCILNTQEIKPAIRTVDMPKMSKARVPLAENT